MTNGVIPFLAQLWLRHVIIAAVPCLLIVIAGRKRARWQRWEIAAFVLPFVVWAVLTITNSTGKTIANAGEAFLISVAIIIAALIRVAVGYKEHQAFYPKALLLLLCCVAVAAYLLTPGLPE